jgi:hypothetical protein
MARLFAKSRYEVNNSAATEGCNIFALFRKRTNIYRVSSPKIAEQTQLAT